MKLCYRCNKEIYDTQPIKIRQVRKDLEFWHLRCYFVHRMEQQKYEYELEDVEGEPV